MQQESLELMKKLCDEGFEVMLETGGSYPIENIDQRVKIIMDLKCPSSGMEKKNLYANIQHLKKCDEIKFVIGNRTDYEWSKNMINTYDLEKKCELLISPVFNLLKPIELAEWILQDKLNVRLQLQLHKYIWDPDKRGV